MSAAHTPGPWSADRATAGGLGKPVICEWFVRRDSDNLAIAADVIDPDTEEPSEANARLIAAAPELLEALAYVIRDLEMRSNMKRGEDKGLLDLGQGAYEQARAAIAKATGEAA